MAYYEQDELKDLYATAKDEAYEWRRDYQEYERLADNGLLEDLDESLPEVNDGSLAAALFKVPKRVVKEPKGRFNALDADDAWITELANIYWENKIIPNANSQAPLERKNKDVVRKGAIYGSQPVITLLMDKDGETLADYIVPYVQDVRLEPGKVSDLDSDIIFWDVYYTRKQVRDLIEQAKTESSDKSGDNYNKWDVKALQMIYDAKQDGEDRDQNEEHEDRQGRAVTKGGIKFCIAFQRGVKAPFYMYHWATNKVVREWENPDPTGDIPVKYFYWYQDFNNPYGIGIVKLAGGTQNTLDIIRKYDILATVLGVRPPRLIQGNEDEVDEDSMIYAQDANWYIGNAQVTPFEMANGVYNQIPNRYGMYKTSLNQLIPTGDTSISAESGDPQYSKTPAGVKFQAANLSIDDEDVKANFNMFFEGVAKNMINITFANMQGSDLLKLNDDQRDLLMKAGLEFPIDAEGNPTNELEIIWDEARATFDFELDAEDDKVKDDQERLQGLIQVLELRATDPTLEQMLQLGGKRLNLGELYSSIIALTTDNDKILEDIDPEEMEMQQQQMLEQQAVQEQPQQVTPEQAKNNMAAVMSEYGVDEETAAEMLMMEEEGIPPEEIQAAFQQFQADQQGARR